MTDNPPAGVDPKSGEVKHDDAEVQVRPFAELLTLFDRGAVHTEASEQLHNLIGAVQSMGKEGSMTIAIKVAPMKGTRDQVVVAAQVSAKPPKGEPTAAVFFVDQAGNLTRNDPRQLEFEGMRVVEPKPARTVEA